MVDPALETDSGSLLSGPRAIGVSGLRVGLTLLLVAIAMNGCGIRIGTTNFRLEVIASVSILFAILSRLRLTGYRVQKEHDDLSLLLSFKRLPRLRFADIDLRTEEWLIGAWLGANILASLVASPERMGSLKLALLLGILATTYGLIIRFVRDPDTLAFALKLWLLIGGGAAALAMLATASFVSFGTMAGMIFEKVFQPPADVAASLLARGTLWEPNVLGSYSMTVALIAIGLLIAPRGSEITARWISAPALAFSLCALVLSISRATMVAFGVATLFLAAAAWRMGIPRPRVSLLVPAILWAGAGIGLGATLAAQLPRTVVHGMASERVTEAIILAQLRASTPPVSETADTDIPEVQPPAEAPAPVDTSSFRSRLTELLNPLRANNIVRRMQVAEWALKQWWQKPWIGWGTGAARFANDPGNSWISNLELHLLHDSGIVGFVAFFGAVWLILRRALRALRSSGSDHLGLQCVLLGLLSSVVGLAIAFQFTEGTWLGYSWAVLGLVTATSQILERGISTSG